MMFQDKNFCLEKNINLFICRTAQLSLYFRNIGNTLLEDCVELLGGETVYYSFSISISKTLHEATGVSAGGNWYTDSSLLLEFLC